MKLVAILKDGKPGEEVGPLSQTATDLLEATRQWYTKVGFNPPWNSYISIEDGKCVGVCAFKTPPEKNRVEIAYATFPEYQGKGHATQTVRELIKLAEMKQPGVQVFAQTLPEENASTSILKKLKFAFVGEVMHPEDGKVWEWELPRPRLNK